MEFGKAGRGRVSVRAQPAFTQTNDAYDNKDNNEHNDRLRELEDLVHSLRSELEQVRLALQRSQTENELLRSGPRASDATTPPLLPSIASLQLPPIIGQRDVQSSRASPTSSTRDFGQSKQMGNVPLDSSGRAESMPPAETNDDLPETGRELAIASSGDPPSDNSTFSSSRSIHSTRTGRISKAKKGLKVHSCECGRSYTRSEHLRRHQKNHTQEGALVCEVPDCGKTFHRVDLLMRHQERHNLPLGTTLPRNPLLRPPSKEGVATVDRYAGWGAQYRWDVSHSGDIAEAPNLNLNDATMARPTSPPRSPTGNRSLSSFVGLSVRSLDSERRRT